MAYVELVEKDMAPPEVLAIYAAGESTYGQVLQTWKAIAHNPAVLQAYLPYVRSIFGPGPLDERTKQLVAIRVCYLNQCRYSLSHRIASATKQGIAHDDLIAVADPASGRFTEAELAAMTFAEELTVGPANTPYADSPQVVSKETLDAVKASYSDSAINDLAITVGLWNLLTRYHRVMDFDLDMPPPPPQLDPALDNEQ